MMVIPGWAADVVGDPALKQRIEQGRSGLAQCQIGAIGWQRSWAESAGQTTAPRQKAASRQKAVQHATLAHAPPNRAALASRCGDAKGGSCQPRLPCAAHVLRCPRPHRPIRSRFTPVVSIRYIQVTIAPRIEVTTRPYSSSRVPIPASRMREQERCRHRADLGEGGGKSGAHAAHLGGEDLAGKQIGLRVRAEVGHEAEQHEPDEDDVDLAAPLKSIENEAISRPTAQPMKPRICNLIRPAMSASTTAQKMPTISSTLIIAAPLAARMSSEIMSLRLRI